MKASIVERFNRTIKEKMWRLFTANKNKKYVNFLDDLMSNYNNSYHRSIKNSPNSINKSNEKATFNNLYGFDFDKGSNEIITFQFNIGDYIRLVINKNLFAKGYTINWSDEVFLIHKRQATSPPTYKIISLSGVVLTKTFYEKELNKLIYEEFPYDTFNVLKETVDSLLIEKLNTKTENQIWVKKKDFLNE